MSQRTTTAPGEAPPPTARRLLRRALFVLVGLGLSALAVEALSSIGFGRIGSSLTSVDPWYLVLAIALDGFSLCLRAVSWQAVLRAALPNTRFSFPRVLRATMVGVLVSAIAPGRVGEPARAWLVARRTGQPRRSFTVVLGTVFSQTLINLVALAILAGVTFASVAIFRSQATALIAAVAVPVAIALLVVSGPRLLALAQRARSRRVRAAAAWIAREVVEMRRGLRVFRDGRRGLAATAAQLAAWVVQTLAVYAVILALHLQGSANLVTAAAILLAVNVTAVVPVTPSNLGVFQAACVAVLAAYGVPAARGVAYGILLQAVEVVTAILLGTPALLSEGVSWRELRRTVPSEPDDEDPGDAVSTDARRRAGGDAVPADASRRAGGDAVSADARRRADDR